MPRPILVVSVILAAVSLLTIGLGVSLIPTDMGRAWLNIGFILFTGAMLALSLGYATKALVAALEKQTGPVVPLSVDAAEDEPENPATPEAPMAEPTPSQPTGVSPGLVAAGAAALGAGAVALGLQTRGATPDATPDAAVEDLEKEILMSDPAVEEIAGAAPAEALPEGAGEFSALPSIEPAPEDSTTLASGDATFDLRLFPDEKIGAAPGFEPDVAGAAAVEPLVLDKPTEDGPAPQAADVVAEDHGLPAGLIPDEDLARLAEEDMTLAPLDTLDVVGAYDSAGVRFTMYSDGSVNAVAPHGTRRYRSLEALRKQLDAGLPAV